MGELFGREYSLTIGTLDVSKLRCAFKVKKNLKPEPNTCEIKVWNLSGESRSKLESAAKLPVRLEAGYTDPTSTFKGSGTSQLYLGEVRTAHSFTEGPDIITEVETGDSEKEIQKNRIHVSIGPMVPVEAALASIATALKVNPGNIGQAVALLKTKGVAAMFGRGTALSGNAARELTDFCRSAGLEWSIQDGKLQILDRNKPLAKTAILLSSSSGLIGSPTVDGKGVVKAKCLIIPDIFPGRLVVFNARHLKGGYRIEEVEFNGDTHGQDWYAELSLKKY